MPFKHCLSAACLILCFACKPPLTALKEAGCARVSASIDSVRPSANFQEADQVEGEVVRQFERILGQELRIVPKKSSDPCPQIQIHLITPERAEVPSYLQENVQGVIDGAVAKVTFGLFSVDMESELCSLGLDRDYVRARIKDHNESAILTWGLFVKTAKRNKLKQLGYVPILFTGQFTLRAADGTSNLMEGLFFGWDAVKYMKPLSGQPQPPTEAQILEASAEGLAEMLKERWSKVF